MSIPVEILIGGNVEVDAEAIKRNNKITIELRLLASLAAIAQYLSTPEGKRVAVVVVDFGTATEGMGGGDSTLGRSPLLGQIKSSATNFGCPVLVGVSQLPPFAKQLKAMGCDVVCQPSSLESSLITALAGLGEA